MKTIKIKAVITGIRRTVDRSLSITVRTPELTPIEAAYFMEYQNIASELIITPDQEGLVDPYEVKSDPHQKSPSQRLRGVLYLLWEKRDPTTDDRDFEMYYKAQMEAIIEKIREKLNNV